MPPAEQVAELGRRVRKILARTRKTVLFGAEIGSFGNEDLDIPGPSESDLESCPDTHGESGVCVASEREKNSLSDALLRARAPKSE